MKKMKLKDLKVDSFVTKQEQHIKGGDLFDPGSGGSGGTGFTFVAPLCSNPNACMYP